VGHWYDTTGRRDVTNGRPGLAFAFTVAGGRITEIRVLADPERLRRVELAAADPG
jgi:ketosteroid isomerase-like protein